MALENIFKKEKGERKKSSQKGKAQKGEKKPAKSSSAVLREKSKTKKATPEKQAAPKKEKAAQDTKISASKEKQAAKSKDNKKFRNEAYEILYSPHIAEKPTRLAEENQYVFKVYSGTNKSEVKKAVEDVYNVNVIKVRTINVSPKRRTMRGITGWRSGYKKAIVTIKEGQRIEILPR